MKSPSFVGVDVSEKSLDTAIEAQPGVAQVSNEDVAIRAWLKRLEPHSYIGVESTGSYHRLLVRLALAAGHTVYILNARDLSYYARSVGRRAKTDRLDAQLIARYLSREYSHLHPYRLPTAVQAQLDELIQRRHVAVTSRATLRQSFAHLTKRPRALMRTLDSLQALIDELDRGMQSLVTTDPNLAPIAKNLRGIVGFGPLLSTSMANAITRHPFKSSDALIAYIGYDPRARDSGQLRGRRFLSKRGSAELRRQLYCAAMSAAKTKLWRPFYERYRARGLSTTATLVILARKLIRIAFSIAKNGTTFKPELIQNACA